MRLMRSVPDHVKPSRPTEIGYCVGFLARQHEVELAALRIDDDGARLLVLVEVDDRRLGGLDVGPLAAVHVLGIDDGALSCAPRGALGLRLLGHPPGVAVEVRGRARPLALRERRSRCGDDGDNQRRKQCGGESHVGESMPELPDDPTWIRQRNATKQAGGGLSLQRSWTVWHSCMGRECTAAAREPVSRAQVSTLPDGAGSRIFRFAKFRDDITPGPRRRVGARPGGGARRGSRASR